MMGVDHNSARRVGEKAIQKIGLAAPSNDANTGDIEQPWNSFVHMRDGLKDIQAQVGRSLVGEARAAGTHPCLSGVRSRVELGTYLHGVCLHS